MTTCPLCHLELAEPWSTRGDGVDVHCLNCGRFRASNTFLAVLNSFDTRGRASISHRLALRASGETVPSVTSYDLDDADANPVLPAIPEAKSRLLLWVRQRTPSLGHLTNLTFRHATAFVGVETWEALPLLLKSLGEDGMIDVFPRMGGANVRLTLDGWQKVESVAALGSTRFAQTDWSRVDRTVDELRLRLSNAQTEEQCQAIGLLCREILISTGQAVSATSSSEESPKPSETDAKALLEAFLTERMVGPSQSVIRKYARAAWDLAVELQHKRTATPQQAALCAEATAAAVNVVTILARASLP